jgi:hypothetical protein
MVSFYRHFRPGIARMLQPLTGELTGTPRRWHGRPSPPSRQPRVHWRLRSCWHTCPKRSALPSYRRLQHPRGRRFTAAGWGELAATRFLLKEAVGVGTWYSTFVRELLAAFSVVRHFWFLLEGRRFRLMVGGLASGGSKYFESSSWQPTGSTSSPWEDSD